LTEEGEGSVNCGDIEGSLDKMIKRIREAKNTFEEDMIVMRFLIEADKCLPWRRGPEAGKEAEKRDEKQESGRVLSKLRKLSRLFKAR